MQKQHQTPELQHRNEEKTENRVFKKKSRLAHAPKVENHVPVPKVENYVPVPKVENYVPAANEPPVKSK